MNIDLDAIRSMMAAALPQSQVVKTDDIAQKKRSAFNRALGKVSPTRQLFLGQYGVRSADTSEYDALCEGLKSGKYAKPSEYVDKWMDWLFGAFIPEAYRQETLDAVDRCLTQPYAVGWSRRSMRAAEHSAYAAKIQQILQHFAKDVLLPYDLHSVLSGSAPEEVQTYLSSSSWQQEHAAMVCRIASALDRGDAQLEAIIRDMLMGDGKAVLMREVICGVLQSSRSDMHELIGKLLLAARLQEGLRQVICENADMGTPGAFMILLKVIEENDLIRFSSVKRAVGTWLGLMTEDSGDLERVSAKSVQLIRQCLADECLREECLSGEDSMALHIALWAIAFQDVRTAVERAWTLAENGTHHQRLTCGYFMNSLNEPEMGSWLSKRIILHFPEELDTLAVYLPGLTPRLLSSMSSAAHYGKRLRLQDYYADAAQARAIYDQLMHARSLVGKQKTFSPCIFPWHSAQINRSDLAGRIVVTAALLEDDALLDEAIALLPECSVDNRDSLLQYCCGTPRTPRQRSVLISAMCDKGEYVRKKALECVKKLRLHAGDYLALEALLRYKYADVRPGIIELLMQQEDEALHATMSRLLADKADEKRIAALDMMDQLLRDGTRTELTERCRPLISDMAEPTAKEKPLLESIRCQLGEKQDEQEPLYTPADCYHPQPVIDKALQGALGTYALYFPDAQLPQELSGKKAGLLKRIMGRGKSTLAQAQEDIASLTECLLGHSNDAVKNWNGEEMLLCNLPHLSNRQQEGGVHLFPVWKNWYEAKMNDPQRLMRACVLINASEEVDWADEVQRAFGTGYHVERLHPAKSTPRTQLCQVLVALVKHFVAAEERHQLALSLLNWLARCVPDKRLWIERSQRSSLGVVAASIMTLPAFSVILTHLTYDCDDSFPSAFNASLLLEESSQRRLRGIYGGQVNPYHTFFSAISQICPTGHVTPSMPLVLRASAQGLISIRAVYAWLFGCRDAQHAMTQLSRLSALHRAQGQQYIDRRDRYGIASRRARETLQLYLGHEQPEGERDAALLRFADEVCTPLLQRIIDGEIRRGDTPGEYSHLVKGVTRVHGASAFADILAALGKDKLVRSDGYYFYGANASSRTTNLCQLLIACVPEPEDTAEGLRQMVKARGISNQRLIEAALYSPEWIGLVSEALDMPGFQSAAYYFMAHMNDEFDDVRFARIARYTPLSADELKNGAFDIAWFRSAYEALGEKRFDMVYDAAKYITSGAKHARARKYADAVLGRFDPDAVKAEVIAKRNKDLLMAYPLIPLRGEGDVQERYLYLQQFLKESRSFGAQRAASEKTSVEIALANLAMNAGYSDAMRLTLRMETRLTEENNALFEPYAIDDVTVRLAVDGQGAALVLCEKNGKLLKSIPAKLKKHEHILRLNEMKKQLVEQQRRARRMLEEAMESSAVFTAGEIAALMANPVIAPMLAKVVFRRGDGFGFTDGHTLTDAQGAAIQLDAADEMIIAHPFHLWQAKQWLPFQQKLFADRIIQPFRQVFRELYIKTPEEVGRTTSLRYAGHQLQPARTLACLKTRRWIADAEAGLQKVFYQENIVATIWAIADWFSPADIEAPTLEHVAFLDRKTGKLLTISEVPDILFSEVMRDVDLAVSVAHAGGVDPESSHSTIEMRGALLAFTLPLFRLSNVRIENSHAFIDGQLAKYSVHLGSGVVHQRGGTMLSVLPVHSQHRGKLFLPFADDDPKTAEIISKVLLSAEDQKIKDPTILEQIG
ncbi:MAG: DUF4132 domain-containing protein [Clostridia bacterium]|nr:DUF4132 domain-containing protein [Clostridia bacterium]